MSSDLTLVIPCRGSSRALVQCTTTLARQWPPDLSGEILIVDDGSGDTYAGLPHDFNVSIRVVRMAKRGGPGVCRNTGVREAKSEWIAFVDDDCLIPWGWLARARALMSDNTPRLIGGRVRARKPGNWWSQAMEDFVLNPTWQDGTWHVVTANCLVHRDAWAAVRGFDPAYTFAGGEDWDFSERVASAGFDVSYAPELWCFHHNATSPGPYFERAVRYGRAHAHWRFAQQGRPDKPTHGAVRAADRPVSLLRRKASFLFRRYLELRREDVPRVRTIHSVALFAMFVAVFDLAAHGESRKIRRGVGVT